MAHEINAVPNQTFKKGDKVQHLGTGWLATVDRDQTDPKIIWINWDQRPEKQPQSFMVEAFRVAPWHNIGYAAVDDAGLEEALTNIDPVHLKNFTEAGLINPPKPNVFKFKEGDRVKLRYNRSCGTIAVDQQRDDVKVVKVIWDKDKTVESVEEIADLVILHAPRDTDPVNPNQDAIDAIEVQRTRLKKEVEDLQSRLSNLTTAKRLLERG